MADSAASTISEITLSRGAADAIPLQLVRTEEFEAYSESLSSTDQTWLSRQGFTAKPGQFAWTQDNPTVLVGWNGEDDFRAFGNLAHTLPEGVYRPVTPVSDQQILGWLMGAYRFNRYKKPSRTPARIDVPAENDAQLIADVADAVAFGRDLINTPAADMAPSHLVAEATALAEQFDAQVEVTVGDALLDRACGAIHAVGRAAEDPPALIDLTWGDVNNPGVTLVGKGVTFDSGGLDLKPASGMRLMKKDMGGAATALGLAHLIMAQALPLRLRVLIPCAENAVAGNAFRPGDILSTHKGLTVEIDNTDAEGRLLLCDALSIASEDKPKWIFDFATLTGSARSAVGTEIAAMFSSDADLATELAAIGVSVGDPVWPMPLHGGYEHMLDSKVADVVNSASTPYAGAITAALFLQRFVGKNTWTHFDIMGFNTRSRPGHPEGGETMGLRTVFAYLKSQVEP